MNKIIAVLNITIVLALVALLHSFTRLQQQVVDLKQQIAQNELTYQQVAQDFQLNFPANPIVKADSTPTDAKNPVSIEQIRGVIQSELRLWTSNQEALANQKKAQKVTYQQLSESGKAKRDKAYAEINDLLANPQLARADFEKIYSSLQHLPTDEKKKVLRIIAQRTNSGTLKPSN